jgi:ribosomal protein S18 acetylase RimI-like enzyme
MLKATIVTSIDELIQIHRLNQQNLRRNLDINTQQREGFVTWLYSPELLQKMHKLSPSIIVKDGGKVVAYALTTLKESKAFHPDLETMFCNLADVHYKNKPLSSHRFYCMGQICIDKRYRGKGIVTMLYQKHKETYGEHYEFLLTEISANNFRSLKAHDKIGFQTIYTYKDAMDEWKVVIWDWN